MDGNTLSLIGVVVAVGILSFMRGRRDITPADAHELVASGAVLLDVRTRDEFGQGHIEGALNIPLHELESRIRELPDKQRAIVVYCRSGNRSGQAKRMLERSGYHDVRNLGAMSSW